MHGQEPYFIKVWHLEAQVAGGTDMSAFRQIVSGVDIVFAYKPWLEPVGDFIHGQAHSNTIASTESKRYTVFHSPGTGSVYTLALLALNIFK